VAESPVTFAGLLRKLRREARLTQEELAEAAGVSVRAVAYLERGTVTSPQKDTVRLLAEALHLIGPVRVEFEAIARGRAVPGGVAAATRTLPRDVTSFTGRQRELGELVDAAAAAHQVVSIHAIGGMAGIGKTAFAVHAAHRLADRFPAGQIFLPLHGHTPGQQPVEPADALASLLLTAGVAPAQMPPGLEARMALWRDRLAGQQLLLILDDAAGSEQVLPLLPGRGGTMVLITSRRHLSALEDATVISLDTLPAEEAAGMLVRLAGRPGLQPADPPVREIVGLCGFLPLAIGMVGRQLHHHPVWSTAGRAAELAAARDRLELMAAEHVSVAAAFDLSYADLSPDQQRLFRRLGLHPGSEVDAYAAAALDGTVLPDARRGLEALYDHYLLAEPAPGRYRMHDLIREHARSLAGRDDPAGDQDQAIARLLDYYQHTAARAEELLGPLGRPAPAFARPVPGPVLDDREQALAWARAERASLLACLDLATGTGQHARIMALTAGIASLLRFDGPWAEAITRHSTAVEAARQTGDRLSQAGALTERGGLRRPTGDYPGAAQDLEEALGIYRGLGNGLGQARVLGDLGHLRMVTSDYPGAVADHEEELAIYRDLGHRGGQALAFGHLAAVRLVSGDYLRAAPDLKQALAIHRDLGNQPSQVDALLTLATLQQVAGEFPGAARDAEEGLSISRGASYRVGEGNALQTWGDLRRRTADYPAAARDLEEALAVYGGLGLPLGQAQVLVILADVRRLTGDYREAARLLEQALAIHRRVGNRIGVGTPSAAWGTCAGWPGTTRARPGTWRKRWPSTAASATGSARATPCASRGPAAGPPGITQPRPGTWPGRWPSSVISARAATWPRCSTSSGRCTGSAGISGRLSQLTSRLPTWLARSAWPGTRRTRWPAWAGAP
jgi:tetratricopeptide (TPR) repeat protein/transcriptional regulator with XRE-family HTH domain